MNRSDFYKSLRRRESGVFGTSLSQSQVDGCEALLDAMQGLPVSYAAYLLATAYHETAHTMQPVMETLADNVDQAIARLERAWRRGKLPWVKTPYWRKDENGKSWLGRGYVQLTWKRNYEKAAALTSVDLVGNPDKAMIPAVAAKILVEGSSAGMFTGKALRHYLPGDYVNARRVINRTDKAQMIARYARAFEAALEAAGYSATPPDRPVSEPQALETPRYTRPGFFALLWALIGGKK